MRTVDSDLLDDIARGTTTLARLFKVTRTDATVLRFTDHDRPIVYHEPDLDEDHTYRADITFDASAIFTSSTLANAQSVTLRAMLATGGITEDDLRSRKYDGAVGDISVINYEAPEHGVVKWYHGVFGQVVLCDKFMAEIELTPAGAALEAQAIGVEVFQPTCRNAFGDSDCTKDIGALGVSFTVTAVDGQDITAVAFNQADDYFTQGFISWSTGDNVGTKQPIRASVQTGTKVSLVSMPLHAVQIGDQGSVVPACDKLPETCLNRWNNFTNFRGEPQVPDASLLQDEPISRER